MSMKSLRLFLALAAIFLKAAPQSDSQPTANSDSSAASAIRVVLDEQLVAWNRPDIAAFMQGYGQSADLSFASSTGVTRGRKPVLDRYRQRYQDAQAMGHLDFTNPEIHPLGNEAAFVLGRWHLQRAAGERSGVFPLVFQRFPEGWRIVHDHTSADAKNGS
jgi:ketosteroid isomerase-like protein